MKFSIKILVVILTPLSSVADESKELDFTQIGQIGYALWDCASYAALFEQADPTGVKLFEKGHAEITLIVEAWRNGNLTKEGLSELPVGISWNLISGPSTEFSLGVMWSRFLDHAHDETWPDFKNASYDEEKKFQIKSAEAAFRDKNCRLLIR